MRRLKGFSKNISRLYGTAKIMGRNKTRLKNIMNKMKINLDVLCLFMEDKISYNVNGRLAVTIKRNKTRKPYLKIMKKLTEPFKFAQ